MAHAGRPATKLQITDAERAELKVRLRVRKAPEDGKRTVIPPLRSTA